MWKTRCYCILCPRHPLYAHRKDNDIEIVTGWRAGRMIYRPEQERTGANVECLEPDSYAFDELDVDPRWLEFPITAYNDGASETAATGTGYEISATCGNETYIEEDNKRE